MIVADTSALISLSTADCLTLVFEEFEVRTTATVRDELEQTAAHADPHGAAATRVLDHEDRFTLVDVDDETIPETSRIDRGEGSCVVLADQSSAEFLLTDDLRTLPELQQLADARVAISPIALNALVKRGVLGRDDARQRLEQLAETRDWLGAPIYRRAIRLFEDG